MKTTGISIAVAAMLLAAGCGDKSSDDAKSKERLDKAAGQSNAKSSPGIVAEIAAGIFMPAISDSMTKANMTAMSQNGRKIVDALTEKSIYGDDCWPHLTEKDGLVYDATDEVYGNVYGSSTEYFKKLFDVTKQTSSDWTPCIDYRILECLWGQGVNPATPGNLQTANVAWTIVAGATGLDDIPALVSANVNTDMFIVKGEVDTSNDNRPIPLGVANGAPKDMFGNKGAVVLYRDGSSRIFMADEFTMRNVYRKRVVCIPDGLELKYLKP